MADLERCCTECDDDLAASHALLTAIEQLAHKLGSAKGAARWMQILQTESDEGVTAWWLSVHDRLASAGNPITAAVLSEASKFVDWMQQSDESESDDEASVAGSDGA